MQAKITLEYEDAKTAKAVAEAVSPDNFKTPKGLSIKTSHKNGKVTTGIDYSGKLATFIATIDDLLACTNTAEKTIRMTKKMA